MNRIDFLQSLSDNILIDKDKCTFCNICVDTCILDNLRMAQAPCSAACPMKVNVQGYVQEIARGHTESALDIVRSRTPFYNILGRICHNPCETNCHRKQVGDEAVSIRALKRFLADSDPGPADLPEIKPDSGKKAAVLGSGPAGMQAAYDLRIAGHQVTILESESEPGGMMRWAIPEFRLPLDVLQQEVDLLRRMGVEIKCNIKVGRDTSLEQICNEYDAVLIATGCSVAKKLDLPSGENKRVLNGLAYLKEVRAGNAQELSGTAAVIGGGNAAVDTAMTALRMGADRVMLISLEQQTGLPAFREAQDDAAAEGIEFLCGWGPKRLQTDNGRVTGVELEGCSRVFDDQGCFDPKFDACRLKTVACDYVIYAIGQDRDASLLKEQPGLLDGDLIKHNPVTLQSPDSAVFYAGDFLNGPSSVVNAMASGREAAISIDRLFRGELLEYERSYAGPFETGFDIDPSRASDHKRVPSPRHRASRKGDFTELESPFDREAAAKEAARCYSCGQPFGKFKTCWFCLPCEVECPHDALYVEIPYLLR